MSRASVEDFHFYQTTRADRGELMLGDHYVRALKDEMRRRFAAFAVDKLAESNRVESETGLVLYSEYRMDVYVIPPNVLFELINEEATRIAYRLGLPQP